jgi:sphingomyelin phosphodiesterase
MLDIEAYIQRLLSAKPASIANNTYIDSIYANITASSTTRQSITVAHISDLHVDFEYLVGGNTECDFPICCRAENGIPSDQSTTASRWGAYTCDLPSATLESMLAYVRDVVKPDIVIWTGDSVPHNIWGVSEEEVVDGVTRVSDLVFRYLGATAKIYPGMGNHDLYPLNIERFDQPSLDPSINAITSPWA